MLTDYKIAEQREVDGIIYQKVRYYEGDISTEYEYNPVEEETTSVERYRRSNMYEEVEYEFTE